MNLMLRTIQHSSRLNPSAHAQSPARGRVGGLAFWRTLWGRKKEMGACELMYTNRFLLNPAALSPAAASPLDLTRRTRKEVWSGGNNAMFLFWPGVCSVECQAEGSVDRSGGFKGIHHNEFGP